MASAFTSWCAVLATALVIEAGASGTCATGRLASLALGRCTLSAYRKHANRARQARQCLLDGGDPIEIRHEASAAAKVERLKTVTFRQAAEQFLETERVQQFSNETHRKQWRSTLESHAFPELGDLPLTGDRHRHHSERPSAGISPDVGNRLPDAWSRRACFPLGDCAQAFHWRKSRRVQADQGCAASKAEGQASRGAALCRSAAFWSS